MIRECFKLQTGIIFDAHMLKNEVGLDIDFDPNTHKEEAGRDIESLKEPQLLATEEPQLLATEKPQLPATEAPQIRDRLSQVWLLPPETTPKPWKSEGEATEQHKDALSPIYDQLESHAHWKVVEWLPCKLPRSPNSFASVEQ